MGRVINPEGAGKERKYLSRAVVLAIRELMQQSQPDLRTRDLAAFISLALERIYETVDHSVAAWEKRGYWLKADRYRLEWDWANQLSKELGSATLAEDWPGVATLTAKVVEKLNGIKLPQRHRLGEPWVGAWQALLEKHKKAV